MAFLKFIDKAGATSFMSGMVQFGRVKEYLKIEQEKCVGRLDEFENKFYTTKYQTSQGIPTKFIITPNRENVNYALCLYHFDDKHNIDRITEMFEFGDYVVRIDDEWEFEKRIKKGAEKNGYTLYNRDIIYYQDESIEDEMRVMDLLAEGLDYMSFAKRKELFSYQNEYRYLIVDEFVNERKLSFKIESLKGIASIMSKAEFLKTL